MKRTAFHIFITLAALFASKAAMGQEAVYVSEGTSLYVSSDAIVVGMPKTDSPAIVYVTKNTSFTIAENTIFTGLVKNSNAKPLKSRAFTTAKHHSGVKKPSMASKVQHAEKLAPLPVSKHKAATEIAIGCCGASVPSTAFKYSVAHLLLLHTNTARNTAGKIILLKACSSSGINTSQLFEDRTHFARPPNTIG